MTVFADSSALVKLYVDELGHEEIRALSPLFGSELARVEVPAALYRKQRTGEITGDDAAALVCGFEDDLRDTGQPPRIGLIHLTRPLLLEAAALTGRHGLRAYDAVQLATALALRQVTRVRGFAAYDRDLRQAAADQGFTLLPVAAT